MQQFDLASLIYPSLQKQPSVHKYLFEQSSTSIICLFLHKTLESRHLSLQREICSFWFEGVLLFCYGSDIKRGTFQWNTAGKFLA